MGETVAFHSNLICHQYKRPAVAIDPLQQLHIPLYGCSCFDEPEAHKKGLLKAIFTFPSVGLEFQQTPRPSKKHMMPLELVPGF